MTKRAVLYARVSGDDRGKEGRNLAGQLEMGRKYAQEHGYTVVAELAEDDRGASGAEIDLPELGRVREMAQAGGFDVLIVRELDRLSRNLAKQLIVEQELERAGVTIEYVLGEYPDTPEGRLHKHVKATVAEYEREKIAERTTRARRQKAKAGHVITRSRPPYGYRSKEVDGKRTLIIHEPEARIVRMVFDWYIQDMLSSRRIAKRLTEMGVPTWNDIHRKGRKKRGQGEWSPSVVAHFLGNETYIGRWHYSGIPVEVPAIIDSKVWEAIQRRKETNRRTAKRNRKYDYLLSGRIRCSLCGLGVCGTSKVTPKKVYLYYRCNTRNDRIAARGDCNLPTVRADHTDEMVWDWIKSLLTDPAALVIGLRGEQRQRDELNRPLRDRLAVVENLLTDYGQQLERALDLYLSGDFPKEMLTARKAQLERTIEGLERERSVLESTLAAQTLTDEQIETITQYAQRVARGLQEADTSFEARRRIVEVLDVQTVLAVEHGQKVVYVRCLIDEEVLPIVSTTTGRTGWLSWRLRCRCRPRRT